MPGTSIADIEFERAVPLTIRVNPERVQVWPFGIEADLSLDIGASCFQATVPLHALNHDFSTVKAARTGRIGDKVIVSFPPSNLGTSIWHVAEKDLQHVLAN